MDLGRQRRRSAFILVANYAGICRALLAQANLATEAPVGELKSHSFAYITGSSMQTLAHFGAKWRG